MEFAERLPDRLLMDKIKARFGVEIEEANNVLDKHERANAVAALKKDALEAFAPGQDSQDRRRDCALAKAFDAVERRPS